MTKMEWYKLLPPDLLQAAYKSTNELAWPEKEALQVIDFIESKGLMVTTIEPWLATQPGPSPLGFDWYYTYHQSKKIFPESAAEFIRRFDELDPTGVNLNKEHAIVFNLSVKPKI